MATTIKFGLSVGEIDSAIKEIKKYQQSIDAKTRLLVDRLAQIGLQTVEANISSSSTNKGITEENTEHGKRVNVFIEGSLVLFFEFGSGIKYNPSDNPKASELGYGIGTYPDQKHAFDSKGWWYLGEDGQYHHSYGVKATMPMYKASVEMRNQILAVAREEFS